jgi:hypothetical protein
MSVTDLDKILEGRWALVYLETEPLVATTDIVIGEEFVFSWPEGSSSVKG